MNTTRVAGIAIVKIFLALVYLLVVYGIAYSLISYGIQHDHWFWPLAVLGFILIASLAFTAKYITERFHILNDNIVLGIGEVFSAFVVLVFAAGEMIYMAIAITAWIVTYIPEWTLVSIIILSGLSTAIAISVLRDYLSWFENMFDTHVLDFLA